MNNKDLQIYFDDKISHSQNMTTKVKITFRVDDKDVCTKVVCKIRDIANVYKCHHVGSHGTNSMNRVMYYVVPQRNLRYLKKMFNKPFDIYIMKFVLDYDSWCCGQIGVFEQTTKHQVQVYVE